MKTFGLIGKNIDYSFSRTYFAEKFKKEGIDAQYLNFDLSNISEFKTIFSKNEDLRGLNVTIPYKLEVIQFLDRLDENAENIGAVNTIKIEKDDSLTGYNTDFHGFSESLKDHLKPWHTHALILGTGGASLAVAYALEQLGISYNFVSRNPSEDQFNYSDLGAEKLEKHKLIINCTPLGTYPNIENHPELPFQFITKEHLVYDLIYNPEETKLLQLAAARGAKTINGLRMLQLQAEKAWEIWNS